MEISQDLPDVDVCIIYEVEVMPMGKNTWRRWSVWDSKGEAEDDMESLKKQYIGDRWRLVVAMRTVD